MSLALELSRSSRTRQACSHRAAGCSAPARVRIAKDDDRVVAGAAVGSLAVTRATLLRSRSHVWHRRPCARLRGLADWTSTLTDELAAVRIADLQRGPHHLPRVPATGSAPARPVDDPRVAVPACRSAIPPGVRRNGCRRTRGPPPVTRSSPHAAVAEDLFGWGVIYAARPRVLERRRVAASTTSAPCANRRCRWHACAGTTRRKARGYDNLPAETLVDSRNRMSPRSRLSRSTSPRGLSFDAHARGTEAVSHRDVVAERTAELRYALFVGRGSERRSATDSD